MSSDHTDGTLQPRAGNPGDDTRKEAVEVFASSSPDAPTQVGPYKVIREIGRGAMGAVYLTEHVNLQRSFALKILPPQLATDPGLLQRFHREMAAIGRLEHENVVLATDAGQTDGYFYIAMQFIEGCDLQGLLEKVGRIEATAACEIVRQAACGLQHISENGLVHRDIKPSNMIVTQDGQVKILDLGIAMLRLGEFDKTGITAPNSLMGTPDFMAPEQIDQCHDVDIRADIYSLGCTLYTLLSGKAPFHEHETFTAKLLAHSQYTPTSLQVLCPELPRELVAIVEKMMAKSPDDRHTTPEQVASLLATQADTDRLTVLVGGTAPTLSPVSTPESGKQWRDKQRSGSPLKMLGVGAGVIALLGMAGYGIFQATRSEESTKAVAAATQETAELQRENNKKIDDIAEAAAASNRQLDDLNGEASSTKMAADQISKATGSIGSSAASIDKSTKELATTAKSVEDSVGKIADSNAGIEKNTQHIAQTLDAIREQFQAMEKKSAAVDQPQTPGDHYHNARVFGEKGNYGAARKAFLSYFKSDLKVVDPHLQFIDFLKLQEGIAGAREVYNSLPGDKSLPARRLATALLQTPEKRKEQLEKLMKDEPDFAPAVFETSMDYSSARLSNQSFADKRAEKALLTKYLELHDQGKVVRHYLDQKSAIDNVKNANERLVALKAIADSVLKSPLNYSAVLPLSAKEWMVIVSVKEPCTDVLYRIGEKGEYKSTGTHAGVSQIDSRTGKPFPRFDFHVPQPNKPVKISTIYVDLRGKKQGPFNLNFDSNAKRSEIALTSLKNEPQRWIRFHKNGTVYLDLLDSWRALKSMRYSIDNESLDKSRVIPTEDSNDQNFDKFYRGFDLPAHVKYVAIQLEFTDGTKSKIEKLYRLDR